MKTFKCRLDTNSQLEVDILPTSKLVELCLEDSQLGISIYLTGEDTLELIEALKSIIEKVKV